MTPQWDAKLVKRALRTIPVDAIAPAIAAHEARGDGLWCLVGRELTFVLASGGGTDTIWDDALTHAQYVRWVLAQPERVHETHEAAVAFVRSRLRNT